MSAHTAEQSDAAIEVAIADGITRIEIVRGPLSQYEIRAFRAGFLVGAQHGVNVAKKAIEEMTK